MLLLKRETVVGICARLLLAIIFRPIVGKVLLVFLGVLPALVLLADIRAFAVNIPFMDDWQFVPLLEKAKNGTLTFQELFAPHDEHRLLLPRIIIIASMFATGGDYRAQSYITFAVVAVVSICILWLMMRLNGSRNSVLLAWGLANVALFSPIQFHNWLWPMQFAYFLPYTFLALCFCTLYIRIPALPKFVMAAVFALAGNFSFVQGNLIWPAVLPLILFAPGILAKGARRNFAVAWVFLGALAVTLYFWGLEHNSAAPEYAYGHKGIPPTMSTLRLLREHPANTISRMGLFILGMFGNSVSARFSRLKQSYLQPNLRLDCSHCGRDRARGGLAARAVSQSRASVGLPASVHFSHGGLGMRWAGMAQRRPTAYSSLHDLRRVVRRFSDCFALFSLFQSQGGTHHLPAGVLPWGSVLTWTQGLLVGLYLCIQGVNWTYGQRLMEEWRLTRWHAQARLHFLGKIANYAGPNLLGGNEKLVAVMAQILEKLDMLKPPRATDLRISAFGKEIIPDDLKKREFRRIDCAGSARLARLRFRAFQRQALGGRCRPWRAERRGRMGRHRRSHPCQPLAISRKGHANGFRIPRGVGPTKARKMADQPSD